jgi:hypothetical protein
VANVKDVDTALKFYGDVLGLEVLRLDQFRRSEVGFVSVWASENSIIDLRPGSGRTDEGENIDYFCLVADASDREGLMADLESKGVKVSGPVASRWSPVAMALPSSSGTLTATKSN